MSRIEKVVLATNNPKKLTELRRVMAESGLAVEVLGLADFPAYPEPVESERSFEGNAFIKAPVDRSRVRRRRMTCSFVGREAIAVSCAAT